MKTQYWIGSILLVCLMQAGCSESVTPDGTWKLEPDRPQLSVTVRDQLGASAEEQVAAEMDKLVAHATPKTVKVLSDRIHGFSVRGASVQADTNGIVAVELPWTGKAVQTELREYLPRTAFFELRMVHANSDQLVAELFDKGLAPDGHIAVKADGQMYYQRTPEASRKPPGERRKDLDALGRPSPAYELMLEEQEKDGQILYLPCFVNRRHLLTGEHIRDARIVETGKNRATVRIEFDSHGTKMFSRITADYAPGGAKNPDPKRYRRMAIVLDGELLSSLRIAPSIGGMELIVGVDADKAEAVAVLLRCGSLPIQYRWADRMPRSEVPETETTRGNMRQ